MMLLASNARLLLRGAAQGCTDLNLREDTGLMNYTSNVMQPVSMCERLPVHNLLC